MSRSRSGVVSGRRGTETCVCSALHCPCRLEHASGEGGCGAGASGVPWRGCGRGRQVRLRIGQSCVGMRDKWACGLQHTELVLTVSQADGGEAVSLGVMGPRVG